MHAPADSADLSAFSHPASMNEAMPWLADELEADAPADAMTLVPMCGGSPVKAALLHDGVAGHDRDPGRFSALIGT